MGGESAEEFTPQQNHFLRGQCCIQMMLGRKQLLVCMRSNPNSVSEQSRELTDPSQKCWREQDNHKEKQSTTTKRAHFYFCPCQLHDPRQPLSPPGGPHLRCEPSRLVTLKVLSKQKKLCVCTRTCVCMCVQNFKQ